MTPYTRTRVAVAARSFVDRRRPRRAPAARQWGGGGPGRAGPGQAGGRPVDVGERRRTAAGDAGGSGRFPRLGPLSAHGETLPGASRRRRPGPRDMGQEGRLPPVRHRVRRRPGQRLALPLPLLPKWWR